MYRVCATWLRNEQISQRRQSAIAANDESQLALQLSMNFARVDFDCHLEMSLSMFVCWFRYQDCCAS